MWRYGYEWKREEEINKFFNLDAEKGREAWTDWQTLAAYCARVTKKFSQYIGFAYTENNYGLFITRRYDQSHIS